MPRINREDYLYNGCVVHVRLQINNGEFLFKKKGHFKRWQKIALRYLSKYNRGGVREIIRNVPTTATTGNDCREHCKNNKGSHLINKEFICNHIFSSLSYYL